MRTKVIKKIVVEANSPTKKESLVFNNRYNRTVHIREVIKSIIGETTPEKRYLDEVNKLNWGNIISNKTQSHELRKR